MSAPRASDLVPTRREAHPRPGENQVVTEPVDPDADAGPPAPSRRARAHRRTDVLAAVAAGGALGSLLRYGIGEAWPVEPGRFPTSTVVVNLVGSLTLGFVLVLLVERLPPNRYARAFLGIGVIGAFTTFSSFAVETVELGRDGHLVTAASSVAVSVFGGLVLGRLGMAVARSTPHRRLPPPTDTTETAA